MKIIHLREILNKGLDLELNKNEEWVLEVLKNGLGDMLFDPNSIKGKIHFTKTEQIVDFHGDITFTYFPGCAHCGKELKTTQTIQLQATLAPLFTSPTDKKKNKEDSEEVELTKDDIEFSFYENDEIRVDTILNDEILLSLPYNYYCKDKTTCKLPQLADEHISLNDNIDPRWLKLKNLKIDRK